MSEDEDFRLALAEWDRRVNAAINRANAATTKADKAIRRGDWRSARRHLDRSSQHSAVADQLIADLIAFRERLEGLEA